MEDLSCNISNGVTCAVLYLCIDHNVQDKFKYMYSETLIQRQFLAYVKIDVQSNLDTTYLGITYFLLLHTFLPSPVFSPSLSLLIYPQYNVHFTTYNLLQRSFSGRPKFVFSYMFQPRYNVYRKTAISCQIWSKNHSRDQPHI